MEYAQRTYIHGDEVKGLYVNMGSVRIESNGHGEGKEEIMNLVETIKNIQRDVLSYNVDNEKLMRAQEHQNGIKIRLLQSLDKIEKKVDKEIETSKSMSHGYHAKRGEFRSVGIHHHHSPRHSDKREKNSPSLSSIRKHKRISRVDELQGEFKKIKPSTFDGEHKKDEDEKAWLLGMRKYF
jgi:hypothetical protein